MNDVDQYTSSLNRSKSGFLNRLTLFFKAGELNQAFYEELEEILITGDVGVQTTMKIIDRLKEEAALLKIKSRQELKALFKETIKNMLIQVQPPARAEELPHVILMVGVNGAGKTTTAGKLAHHYSVRGKKVMLVAGDTFRAAATEQLEIWAQRAGAAIVKQQQGTDPSALFFDAVNSARAKNADILIGDTAGRLHNQYNLMEELSKINRVIAKAMPGAPHEILLTVDATTGQNALAQAQNFNLALPLTGLVLAKLDGTARGGIVIGIQDLLNIPVCYIGTGEAISDLIPFKADLFAEAFLKDL